jgi:hypothetical protein
VPSGEAVTPAWGWAGELAAFPQAYLRTDRLTMPRDPRVVDEHQAMAIELEQLPTELAEIAAA